MNDFLKAAIKDWETVGALTESSRYVVKKVLEEIKPSSKLVVEYGPGRGVITKALLKRLPPDGRLLAIEIKKEFAEAVSGLGDPRLRVINSGALTVLRSYRKLGIGQADAVISSIPFTRIRAADQEKIVLLTRRILKRDGIFLVFQNFPLGIVGRLKKHFRIVQWKFEARNFPPYFFMIAQKRTDRVS